MTAKKVLVVEDEVAIREMLRMALERAGFMVREAGDVVEAETAIADELPDLILLDWMLPGTTGVELARRLRRDDYSRELPIILLTARGEEEDKVRGLDSGADDYVVKPFSPRELVARINALLRRRSSGDEEPISFDGLVLDPVSHRVSVAGETLEMGPTEYRLLHFFMSHPERVYSRTQLLDQVWSRGTYVEERTVDVHIRRLRKALTDGGYDRFVQTVRGAGYRFSTQV